MLRLEQGSPANAPPSFSWCTMAHAGAGGWPVGQAFSLSAKLTGSHRAIRPILKASSSNLSVADLF